MISVTKIFRFEAAHAIFGYQGKCSGIHGHSYELHVTVRAASETFLDPAGFIIDFKELKTIVMETIIDKMDHKVLLSGKYIERHKEFKAMNNVIVLESEPSVENLLVFISKQLAANFPPHIFLTGIKLFESKDSYAQWKTEYTSNKYFSSL